MRTKPEALKEARKRWGDRAAVQDSGVDAASTPEERGEARAAISLYRAEKAEIEKKLGDRVRTMWEYLTPEEQEMRTRRTLLTERIKALIGPANRHRFHVGEITRLPFGDAFHVRGSGDTWLDAFADVDRKAASDRKSESDRLAEMRALEKKKKKSKRAR